MKVWIDIENPPQARYLPPLARRLERAGCDVFLTARAHRNTLAILESEGVSFRPVGASFGKNRLRKAYCVAARSRLLLRTLRRYAQPLDFVIAGSRAAALTAWRLRIPSFAIVDYEYVNLTVPRLVGSYIVHPDVISETVFEERGIQRGKLMPFPGLKEDLSFADVDLAAVPPHSFRADNGSLVHVLFRPPAEESHYHRAASRDLALDLLREVARENAQVVFSPRYDWQIRHLEEVATWRHEPVVLQEPVPFVALLKGVDAVISGGGTMVREAAFLGIPAYSVFRSRIGAVDRYLASINRLTILESREDFSRFTLARRQGISPLRDDSSALEAVTEMILERARGH